MAVDPEIRRHQEWLGYLQPVGVTVTPAALVAAQAHVNANIAAAQVRFRRHVRDGRIADFPALCCELLEWQPDDLRTDFGTSLDVRLAEYGETLSPSYAVRDPEDASKWMLLVRALPDGLSFDEPETKERERWHASPQARFERLLRENRVPAGLVINGEAVRLVYAPAGESSGHLTFPVEPMTQVSGRPIFAAFYLLFYFDRLFQLPAKQRLPAILERSRQFQNDVSTKLAEQVLEALYELLRGVRQADWDAQKGVLGDLPVTAPDHVYGGLLTTLMRLVFVLYAEERDLLPSDGAWVRNYSVAELFKRLRDDARRHPDTMDLRYGAWARLLAVFRAVHDGVRHASIRLPARHGKLFDPDAYPFLEGRARGSSRGQKLVPPKISDGVIWRVLEKLLILDGERLSYRALDVEQIGSVYEAMMGFELGVADGFVLALRPDHVVVELDRVLQQPGGERAKYLRDEASCEVSGDALASARTKDELLDALGKRKSPRTPEALPPGSLYLQPTEERRRSGSHYTPRSLTEPIVRTTLEPILKDLGQSPRPERLLELKVCDPAMGSGAFLVAACRLLGERLVESWAKHGAPTIPPDEDELKHAMRLVAQSCLYGVDKNPFAVDLAKLSLWLATMARDHPFTFLDHALRHGDSLVGLTREQIACFHWKPEEDKPPLIRDQIDRAVEKADELRAKIRALAASDDTDEKSRLLAQVDAAVERVRLIGDAAVAGFFGAAKDKERVALRGKHLILVQDVLAGRAEPKSLAELSAGLRKGNKPVPAFHWEVEFPEVFREKGGGFDGIVGNPPFLGGKRISTYLGEGYRDWLSTTHEDATSNADLVALFYRRAFNLIRKGGTFGLIATKTIGQGDTRSTGLRWLCTNDGTIYAARRRIKWPGAAAVVVSVVHVQKGRAPGPFLLDDRAVPVITAHLFHGGSHDNPAVLRATAEKSFIGSYVLGMGFTFDDTDTKGVASPIAEMHRLIKKDARNQERIFPYVGGEEVTTSPRHAHHRYVINFDNMSEAEARKWPDLMRIVEERVKPERDKVKRDPHRLRWWIYGDKRPELYAAIRGLKRVLAVNCGATPHMGIAFVDSGVVFSHTLCVFAYDTNAAFSVLQSRAHETWARFFASTMKNDLRYTPSDCFETFPLPDGFEKSTPLEKTGCEYHDFRAKLMLANNEGLTKTYNRFHDRDERAPEVLRLRELHAAMDRAVLDTYGWTAFKPRCDFILDYEEPDDEEGSGRSRKKPWRYRWVDDDRDEILARLLALNKKRAEEEALAGRPASAGGRTKRSNRGSPPTQAGQGSLF